MEKEFILQRGELSIPVKINEPDFEIKRVVLGVHGIGGSAMDDIQTAIAEEMEFFYSVVYRFDFPAHGESPMDDKFLTLKHCQETLMAVAEHIKASYPNVENLCIFATGFGAYVTLTCLENLIALPGNIKLVVQTPSVRMHETLLAIKKISKATLQAMDKIRFNADRPFDVTYAFYEEIEATPALIPYPIPMLILHGEHDSVIRQEDILNFARINEQSKLVIIPGTTHRFLEEGAWDMVLDLTRDWFEFEQVLLSDWS